MAQIHFTLSEEEIKQIFVGDRNEAMKFLMERILNEVMQFESEEQLGAAMHQRTDERTDYRNGTRERMLSTRIGTLTLEVPRHRNEPFHTMIFDNYQRSEASLIAAMIQMVVSGVSTRKISNVVETLCGKEISKSAVSELCKRLDDDVRKFLMQPLDGLDAPFLMIDATYFKAREDHKIVSKAFLVALAFKSDGTREVISFGTYDSEDNYSWINFLDGLRARGLKSVQMVISDSHKAIRRAIAKVYPEAAWQRCQVHFVRNILDEMPAKYKEGIATELREMFTAPSAEEARAIKDRIVEDYSSVAEKAMKTLEMGFEDATTCMCLPEHMQKVLRSTNCLERLNREFKRRSNVICVFPNEASIFRLMGALAMEFSESESTRIRLYSEGRLRNIRESIESILKEKALYQLSLLAA